MICKRFYYSSLRNCFDDSPHKEQPPLHQKNKIRNIIQLDKFANLFNFAWPTQGKLIAIATAITSLTLIVIVKRT